MEVNQDTGLEPGETERQNVSPGLSLHCSDPPYLTVSTVIYLSDFQCIPPSHFCSSLFGQRPQQGTKSRRMGRFYVRPFVRPPLLAIQPGLRPSQADLRPSQPARPQASGMAGWASGLAGWASGLAGWPRGGDVRTYGRTNGRTENLPILQDFVPYRGRCPASPHENQGESRAGQGNR